MPRSITLYSYISSPYGMKVHAFLLYKKLPFKIVYVNPLHPLKQLPMGRTVPVLKIDNESRAESSLVGQWLDQQYPDTPQLIPTDELTAQRVQQEDQWVTDVLIPCVFFSIYPRFSSWSNLKTTVPDTLRLGYCVNSTTPGGLPRGLRYLWPYFLSRTRFIQRIIAPIGKQKIDQHRHTVLSTLNAKLKDGAYVAGTSAPSLADIAAWSQIVVPYQLGLKHMSDFKMHANVVSWVQRIANQVTMHGDQPWTVPAKLSPRPLGL